jgi:hypothetical protein
VAGLPGRSLTASGVKVAEEQVSWFKKWDKVADFNYGTSADDLYIRWFTNAKLNVSYNCLDRHLDTRGDQTAIIWEGNDPGGSKQIHLQGTACRGLQVCQCAQKERRQKGRPWSPSTCP